MSTVRKTPDKPDPIDRIGIACQEGFSGGLGVVQCQVLVGMRS